VIRRQVGLELKVTADAVDAGAGEQLQTAV
jgi:hypothetical protein